MHVSAISGGEIACLAERGRITLDMHWKEWINDVIDIIQEAYSLPGDYHRDPADRFITATARLRSMFVLTADDNILSYPHVLSIWQPSLNGSHHHRDLLLRRHPYTSPITLRRYFAASVIPSSGVQVLRPSAPS